MARLPTTLAAQPNGTVKRSQNRGPVAVFQQTDDRQTNDLQRGLSAAGAPARAVPFSNGNLITGLVFTAGQTRDIDHGLARAYAGFFVTRAQGNEPLLYEPATLPANLRPAKLRLTSVKAGTYDVWVF